MLTMYPYLSSTNKTVYHDFIKRDCVAIIRKTLQLAVGCASNVFIEIVIAIGVEIDFDLDFDFD